MALLIRLIRFINHEDLGWPLACIAALGTALWLHHDSVSVVAFVCGSTLFGFAPFFFRHALIRNYAKVRRGLRIGAVAFLACVFASLLFGHEQIGVLAFGVYCAFMLGVLFWSASDPLFEMMSWLAFPTECGRLPDEIYLVDQRQVQWSGDLDPVQCYLFKFRYDDEWDYGITGPITFSMFEQDFDGKDTDEIFQAYANWFAQEKMEETSEQEIDSSA